MSKPARDINVPTNPDDNKTPDSVNIHTSNVNSVASEDVVSKLWCDVRNGLHENDFTAAITAHVAAECQRARDDADKGLMTIMNHWLELFRSVTPARPEDLSISDWFAIADALKAAGDEIEVGLSALSAPLEDSK